MNRSMRTVGVVPPCSDGDLPVQQERGQFPSGLVCPPPPPDFSTPHCGTLISGSHSLLDSASPFQLLALASLHFHVQGRSQSAGFVEPDKISPVFACPRVFSWSLIFGNPPPPVLGKAWAGRPRGRAGPAARRAAVPGGGPFETWEPRFRGIPETVRVGVGGVGGVGFWGVGCVGFWGVGVVGCGVLGVLGFGVLGCWGCGVWGVGGVGCWGVGVRGGWTIR